ncbi:hypothetical protein ACJX0J_007290, partial [Zea mays]
MPGHLCYTHFSFLKMNLIMPIFNAVLWNGMLSALYDHGHEQDVIGLDTGLFQDKNTIFVEVEGCCMNAQENVIIFLWYGKQIITLIASYDILLGHLLISFLLFKPQGDRSIYILYRS